MMLTQLARVARRAGYPVVEVAGWKTRGRPGGMSDIRTITAHHTANGGARGDYPSLRVVRDGRPGLPGPLAQLGVGVGGTIYVIAAGKCNHAGASRSSDYLNGHAIGIEAEAVGVPGAKRDWPPAQMDAYSRLCAALVDEFDLSVSDVRGHKETCSPHGRKSDPSFAMDGFRRRVAAVDLKIKPLEEDVQLSDNVKYTPSAKDRLNKVDDPLSTVIQFPPSVRLARDEIARLRREQTAAFGALNKTIGLLAGAIASGGSLTEQQITAAAEAGARAALAELGDVLDGDPGK